MHSYFVTLLTLIGWAVLIFGAVALLIWLAENYGERIDRAIPDWVKQLGTYLIGLTVILLIGMVLVVIYASVYQWVWGTTILRIGG